MEKLKLLTVLLVAHLEGQVLLPQLVVDLLQVLDVINSLPQHSRLVHLQKEEIGKKVEDVVETTPQTATLSDLQVAEPWRRCP